MKKLISGLVILVCILLYVIWIQGDKNDQAKIKIRSLHEHNQRLLKDIGDLSDSIAGLHREIILSEIIENNLDNNVIKLKDGVAHKEEELRNIKGRYEKLTDDSLRNALIKRYEIDSIANANK